jgi:hypothetical protein
MVVMPWSSCSGAMYTGVPPALVRSSASPERPKSVMRALPRPSIITFAGFRSRCTKPRSCAAASPAQRSRASASALSGGRRPMRRSSDARSSPSTYSMVMKCWSPTSITS